MDYLNDLDPTDEVRQFFEILELDVYLERSDEVKQIHDEMRKLAELYVNTKSAKVVGTEGAVQEMHDELVQGKAALVVAIEKAKAAEAAAEIVEKKQAASAEPPKAHGHGHSSGPAQGHKPAAVAPGKRGRSALPSASTGGDKRTAGMAMGALVVSLVSLGGVGYRFLSEGEKGKEVAEMRQALKKELMDEMKIVAETQEVRMKQEITALRGELARVDGLMNDTGRELAKLREVKAEEKKPAAPAPKKRKPGSRK